MKKQSILIISGVIILLVVIAAGQYFLNKKTNIQDVGSTPQIARSLEQSKASGIKTPTPVISTGDISVTLDFGNGAPITGMVYAQNALAALKEIAKARSLEVSVKEFKYGSLIEKIGDTASTKDSYWAYYVNGQLGNVAGDKFIIHPKDTVVWKFEKGK